MHTRVNGHDEVCGSRCRGVQTAICVVDVSSLRLAAGKVPTDRLHHHVGEKAGKVVKADFGGGTAGGLALEPTHDARPTVRVPLRASRPLRAVGYAQRDRSPRCIRREGMAVGAEHARRHQRLASG